MAWHGMVVVHGVGIFLLLLWYSMYSMYIYAYMAMLEAGRTSSAVHGVLSSFCSTPCISVLYCCYIPLLVLLGAVEYRCGHLASSSFWAYLLGVAFSCGVVVVVRIGGTDFHSCSFFWCSFVRFTIRPSILMMIVIGIFIPFCRARARHLLLLDQLFHISISTSYR